MKRTLVCCTKCTRVWKVEFNEKVKCQFTGAGYKIY